MTITASIIVISDRALADPAEDRGGPVALDTLRAAGVEVLDYTLVAADLTDASHAIDAALARGSRVVLTIGSTGVGASDIVVEATRPLLTAELPGIAEAIRRRGEQHQSQSLLSRGLAGVVVRAGCAAMVVNAPSSRGGVRDTLDVVVPLLPHIIDQLDGRDRHDHDQPVHDTDRHSRGGTT